MLLRVKSGSLCLFALSASSSGSWRGSAESSGRCAIGRMRAIAENAPHVPHDCDSQVSV